MNDFTTEQLEDVATTDCRLLVDYLETSCFDQDRIRLVFEVAHAAAKRELEERERIWTHAKWDDYPGLLDRFELLKEQLGDRSQHESIRAEIDLICKDVFGGQFFDLPEPFRNLIDYINGV